MKLSSKSKYGLKACFVLAKGGEVLPLSKIAESGGTTEKYMEQILILLKKGGIVGTQRGTNGGYYLSDKPENISVGRVLDALSDGVEIVSCISSECEMATSCPTKNVWKKLYDSMSSCLNGISLSDMISENI